MTINTPINIVYLIDEKNIVVALQGELRFLDSDWLERTFLLVLQQWEKQKRRQNLVIDLTGADFIDSTIYGLIASYALECKKLAGNPIIVYYNSDDIQTELLALRMETLCLLKLGVSPYSAPLAEFSAIDKLSITRTQITINVHKSHEILADLTDNPAMQAVVDTISHPNKGH